jgi:hypothetical protein
VSVSSVPVVLGWPSPAGANGDSGSAESIGDGLWVDAVSGRDGGERKPAGVQVGRVSEDLAGPFSLRVVALNVLAVERCRNGGTMDTAPIGELIDHCARAVGGDELVDIGGREASLDGV